MRLASFNVENLFSRALVMNLQDWDAGKAVLEQYSRFNSLIRKESYSAADKSEMLNSIEALGLKQNNESEYVLLRENHGRLLRWVTTARPEIVANGRGEWVGWLELKTGAVNDKAIQMTAKVIKDVKADILAVVEAENRIALCRFNDQLLKPLRATYQGIMLIDGNDERGIDVGIMVRGEHKIESMVSHVDDADGRFTIFSRDCPEFMVRTPQGNQILVMVNHFKSKGHGSQETSDARRKKQAQRVREIYQQRRSEGIDHIAIVGDFNDTPESDPLSPLIGNGSDLKDIFQHDRFEDGGRPGTYANCAASNKIDYILLSPALFGKATGGGVWRKGVWGGTNGTIFPHYDEIEAACDAASDHAAVWADIDF